MRAMIWSLLALAAVLGGCDDGGPTPIWPGDASRLVAETGGGGEIEPPPPGSTCWPGDARYTVTVADRKLAWQLCRPRVQSQPDSPLTTQPGERVLADADFQRLVGVLRGLTLVTGNPCGADKGSMSLTVTTPRGDTKYRDAFYKCGNKTDLWVDEDPVFEVLRSLEPAL